MAERSLPPAETGGFSGPIELLLDEVRRQNVAVEKIDLAPLASRFLAYVRDARDRDINLDIEWLHMAATLIQWKSRALLPGDPENAVPAAADPVREEIVGLLRAHRKELAADLAQRKAGNDARLSRPGESLGPEEEEERELPFVSVWDLTQQARELRRWAEGYRRTVAHWRTTFDVEHDPVTVAQMSQVVRDYLAQAESAPVDALPLLATQPSPAHRSALFLGLLEMVRDQEITCEQEELFGSVWMENSITANLRAP